MTNLESLQDDVLSLLPDFLVLPFYQTFRIVFNYGRRLYDTCPIAMKDRDLHH